MYCRKCGKFVDYETEICLECQKEYLDALEKSKTQVEEVKIVESPAQQNCAPVCVQPVQVNNKPVNPLVGINDGLAKGIVSLVLSVFAWMFSVLAVNNINDVASGIKILFVFALGFTIPAFCLGISAVNQVKINRREKRAKPVATFTLGLVGLILSAICLYMLVLIYISII